MSERNNVSSVRNFCSVRNGIRGRVESSQGWARGRTENSVRKTRGRGRVGKSGKSGLLASGRRTSKCGGFNNNNSNKFFVRNGKIGKSGLLAKASRGRVIRSFASKASRGLGESGLARCRLTNKQQHVIILIIKGSRKTNAAFSSDLINFQLSALILVLL